MNPVAPDDVHLVVIGDASIDYFVRVPHLAGNDNKAIGALVGVHGGGMSANLAAAAAAHGAAVSLITKVGDDKDSTAALDELRDVGVQLDETITVPGGHTWLCFVQLDDSGEKALVGADTGVKVPDLGEVTLQGTSTPQIVVPLTDDTGWAADIAERARSLGHLVAVDLEPDATMPGSADFERLVAASDIVFMNRAAAERVETEPAAAARAVLERGPNHVIVSSGRDGAFGFSSDGTALRAFAAGCTTAIDTTGAGDALSGGTLGALARGADLAAAVRVGITDATRCIQHIGSRSYLRDDDPTPVDVRIDHIARRNETP